MDWKADVWVGVASPQTRDYLYKLQMLVHEARTNSFQNMARKSAPLQGGGDQAGLGRR